MPEFAADVGAHMLERLDYVRLAPRRVLDAGSGLAARALSRRYPEASVIALDRSFAALRAGRPRFRLFARGWPVRLCADLSRLPLAAASIDLVWSNLALHHVADPLAAFREFLRVLAAEGLLMFSTLGPDTLKELREAEDEARARRFIDMHDLGDMLVAAGFASPVMDMEIISLDAPAARVLLADLGVAASPLAREPPRAVTAEIVFGHAWKGAPRRAAGAPAVVRFEPPRRAKL